jgi:SpoVK/Ycf46/Vps4 family AAA+-type ATPase
MERPQDPLHFLREALSLAPDNAPLRRHLADSLRAAQRFDEAEREYLALLQRQPADVEAKLALARCYADSGKDSHAFVLIESLALGGRLGGVGHALHAELLLRAGELAAAERAFKQALAEDPALAALDLGRRLGFEPQAARAPAKDEGGSPREDAEEPAPERRVPVRAEGEPGGISAEVERPTITFADVGGMREVKAEIEIKILQPLAHPEVFRAYGKAVGGGILMYGPPGCGKTLLARATAGEGKLRFLAIGIHEVLDMWLGQSERNLHGLFEEARRSAPCILFFDEVDALGGRRSDHAGAGRQVVNQFLAELDGAKASNEGVLVLGATNAPWQLDAAFRRPGRFDRILFVPPPDEAARAAILGVLLAKKPKGEIDCARIAKRAKEFSGADLKAVVDLAIEEKLRAALARGRPEPLTEADLLDAVKKVRPSTKEWFQTARNHALYANQGGLYDDVVKYLGM